MTKVAIVETKPSRNSYEQLFENAFPFDLYHLCSDASKKKVLKVDCDIDIDLDAYDWIILVGADALKFFTSESAVTTFTGKKVDENFLVTINPAMLAFKPESRPVWERSRDSIIDYINGRVEECVIDDSIAMGIQDTKHANEFLQKALDYDHTHVAIDTETTGLYPRDGYIQGISISYDGETGAYIDSNCIGPEEEYLLQQICGKKIVIFHNAKFDIAMLEYHFNLMFPRFEDTMLLHYLIDENPGGHGLKDLS